MVGMHPCPGCGTRYAAYSGPSHRYIGASSGCWALYSQILGGGPPEPELLANSLVDPAAPRTPWAPPDRDVSALLPDAYATQHHGVPSRVAIQSVSIHILTLYGVLRAGVDPSRADWPRRRGLRDASHYTWLTPPPLGAGLSVRHFFAGGGVAKPCTSSDYVASVLAAWEAVHGDQIRDWYVKFVLKD